MKTLLLSLLVLTALTSGCGKIMTNSKGVPIPFPQGSSPAVGCPLALVNVLGASQYWGCTSPGQPDLQIALFADGSAWYYQGTAQIALVPIQMPFPTCETDFYAQGGSNDLRLQLTNVVVVGGNLTSLTSNGVNYSSCGIR